MPKLPLPAASTAESADRRCHRSPMGIAGSNVHCHLFVSAAVSGSLFRSRNRETAIRSVGHFPGIKLGAGVDTNHYIRQLHTESKGKDGSKTHTTSLSTINSPPSSAALIRKKALTLGSITALFILSSRHGTDAPNFFPSGQTLLSGRCILSGRIQHPRSRKGNEKGGSPSDAAAGSETGIRHLRQHPLRYYLASTSVGPQT